jgi:hypothetical protein
MLSGRGRRVDLTIMMAIVSASAAISGIALGWFGRARAARQDAEQQGGQDGYLRANVEYIKRGVDDMRLEQRAQGKSVDHLSERVTRLEESSKQAHKRLDRIEGDRGSRS